MYVGVLTDCVYFKGWSLGTNSNMAERLAPTGGRRKAKPFEHVILQEGASSPDSSQPSEFRRKKHHTPATIPRTKLPPGTPKVERESLERLRMQLTFAEDEVLCIFLKVETMCSKFIADLLQIFFNVLPWKHML